MSHDWELEWYHFADIYCLCAAGKEGNGEELLNELLGKLTLDELKELFEKDDDGSKIPNRSLVSLSHSIVKRFDGKSWRPEWPKGLRVGVRNMEGVNGVKKDEMIITPFAVFLPWPFPIKDDKLREELIDTVEKQAGATIRKLNGPHDLDEYNPDRDLMTHAFLPVFDNNLLEQNRSTERKYRRKLKLIQQEFRKCSESPSKCRDARNRQIRACIDAYAKASSLDSPSIPKEMNFVMDETMELAKTRFNGTHDGLGMRVGLFRPKSALMSADTPEWPCGNM